MGVSVDEILQQESVQIHGLSKEVQDAREDIMNEIMDTEEEYVNCLHALVVVCCYCMWL